MSVIASYQEFSAGPTLTQTKLVPIVIFWVDKIGGQISAEISLCMDIFMKSYQQTEMHSGSHNRTH